MKKALIKAGFYSGMISAALRVWRRRGFRVLMYHHVLAEEDRFLPGISRKIFSRQINYLRRAYRIMDLGEMVKLLRAGRSLPARSLALTFDDGYEDFYDQAFPLLKSLRIPATVFVAAGFIDTDLVPWTDELRTLFRKTAQRSLEIEDGDRKRYAWSDDDGKLRALRRVKERLKALPEGERITLYREIKSRLKAEPGGETRILSRHQIREMAESGISFGGHTLNHVILTRVSPEEARGEITRSKSVLEEITGKPVEGFCYPNGEAGDFNEEIKGLVRGAGYSYACATLEGINSVETDLFELRRMWTSEDSLPLFAARLLIDSK